MNHQFKPGDLALTLKSIGHVPEMACVEIVEILPSGTRIDVGGKIYTLKREVVEVIYLGGNAGYKHTNLMPLRGDFAPDQQKVKELSQ